MQRVVGVGTVVSNIRQACKGVALAPPVGAMWVTKRMTSVVLLLLLLRATYLAS